MVRDFENRNGLGESLININTKIARAADERH
jgi:hypothetical protein